MEAVLGPGFSPGVPRFLKQIFHNLWHLGSNTPKECDFLAPNFESPFVSIISNVE